MRRWLLLILAAVLLVPVPAAGAERACQPNSPDLCTDTAFVPFWNESGGLPVFGYPIGPRTQNTQLFERNRLELHPEAPAAYRVQLGRIGAERLEQLGRNWQAEGREPGPKAGCRWFAETGHNVCNQEDGRGFLVYWQANGLRTPGLSRDARSLALFGLPLTEARLERGADGVERITQWFERARFEWHPQNPARYRVLLGLLGSELQATPPTPAEPSALPASLFGVSIDRPAIFATVDLAAASGASWMRYGDIFWARVEPEQGQRRWEALRQTDAELLAVRSRGLTPIVVVREAPAWAQARPGTLCGPIKPDAYAAFGDFMADLAARYSQPPFNIHHWEIWNEPDVDPALVGADSGVGCWGQPSDPFFGGGAYGELLKVIAPRIRAADPQAQIVFGGLLLDCDPAAPPADRTAEACRPGLFLEGALRAGAGDAFDILDYHAYSYWTPDAVIDWDLRQPSWRHRGGAVLGKLAFIRETMARYGVSKPVLLGEVSLLCTQSAQRCEQLYPDAQANYIVRLYARSIAQQLHGTIWYTFDGPGWFNGGLLDGNQQPRVGYVTLQLLNRLLRGAQLRAVLNDGPLEGYEVATASARYQMLWTNSTATVSRPLPAGAQAIYRANGTQQPLSPEVMVSFEPLIIEIAP